MNGCEITAMVTAAANMLASCYSIEQIDLLAVIFTQLGDTLATISVANGICSSSEENAIV